MTPQENRMTANTSLRRAGTILARIPTPRRGRHAVKPTRRQRCTKTAVTVAAASLAIAGTLAVLTPNSPPPTPVAAVATIPASEAETIFVAELEAAGIRDRFDVRFVLDDRDRVVAAWRSIGLTVYQVAPGDF